MDSQREQTFAEIERLFYYCEDGDNLEQAQARLNELAEGTDDPRLLARIFGELAQAETLRYEYVPGGERLAVTERGVKLAKQALAYDSDNLQANAWAAATMGLHGMEMGILSALFYVGQIKRHAERVLQLDEAYHQAMTHQILGDLYRITPPSPVGLRDLRKSLEHLLRARELGPECPQGKLRLAELYITLRQPDLARREIQLVLDQEIVERGPTYAAKCKAKAREIEKKLA